MGKGWKRNRVSVTKEGRCVASPFVDVPKHQASKAQQGQMPFPWPLKLGSPSFRRSAGPCDLLRCSLQPSPGLACSQASVAALETRRSSWLRYPALRAPVVTATREALTPDPARPRPSRCRDQHGEGQPGSAAAAARPVLGAPSRPGRAPRPLLCDSRPAPCPAGARAARPPPRATPPAGDPAPPGGRGREEPN
jgi:hypothetical protein